MGASSDSPVPPAAGWRLKLGGAMFALSLVGPLVFLPVVTSMDFSGSATATVSGGVLIGAEVLALAAVAVMGKSGYAYLKDRVFGFLKQYGPPAEVSRTRYMLGLVMFVVPIVFGWLVPYAADLIPGYLGNEIFYAILGDVLLLIGLLVLGGDFLGQGPFAVHPWGKGGTSEMKLQLRSSQPRSI